MKENIPCSLHTGINQTWMNQSINKRSGLKDNLKKSNKIKDWGKSPSFMWQSVSTDPNHLLCPVSSRVFLWINPLTVSLCEVWGVPPV